MTHDYGKPRFSFADPRAPQWALFALGLALLAAGALLGVIFAVEGIPARIDEDIIAVAVLMGLCVLGGAALTIVGLRDLVRSPEWHVTATHAFRTRGARVLRAIDLRAQPTPSLTIVRRYGITLSVRVDLGRSAIVAPDMDVARAIVDAWRAAKSR